MFLKYLKLFKFEKNNTGKLHFNKMKNFHVRNSYQDSERYFTEWEKTLSNKQMASF